VIGRGFDAAADLLPESKRLVQGFAHGMEQRGIAAVLPANADAMPSAQLVPDQTKVITPRAADDLDGFFPRLGELRQENLAGGFRSDSRFSHQKDGRAAASEKLHFSFSIPRVFTM
jgi:hypothetical protein